MKKKRLIPILLLKNGWLVQSKLFRRHQNLGNPTSAVKRMSEWASDELIYLDISREEVYDTRRDDLGHANRQSFQEIIEDVAKVTFMPITVGGRIRSLLHIEERLASGADKVTLNTMAIEDVSFIGTAAKEFGAQCIVVSVDVKNIDGQHKVFSSGGSVATEYEPVAFSKSLENAGAGEILVNSIDRDGMRKGYDIELLDRISSDLTIPVIACGGVGEWSHFEEALSKTNVDAVSAANIFH